MANNVTVSTSLDYAVADSLDKTAYALHMNRSEFIRKAVEHTIDQYWRKVNERAAEQANKGINAADTDQKA